MTYLFTENNSSQLQFVVLLLCVLPTSYVIQQHVQHSHGEGGLYGGEVHLFCPPETTDIVIQQGSFLHTSLMVPEAQDLFHFSTGNRKQIWISTGSDQQSAIIMH